MQQVARLGGFICLFSAALLCQQDGQIVGSVTDATGAVVPGTVVKAIEVGTKFVRSTITGDDGRYVLPALRPTRYEVTAESAGFRAYRHTGVELLANQSLTLNIALEVGAVTETLMVEAAAVQVNTTTSTLSEVVDNARIMDLVLNGRDVAKLAAIVPGVAVISVSTESGKSIPGGLQLTSNGMRNQQVSYRLDGATNTDSYFQENQSFPFPDAVQGVFHPDQQLLGGAGQ
jgi:hypothetical protein